MYGNAMIIIQKRQVGWGVRNAGRRLREAVRSRCSYVQGIEMVVRGWCMLILAVIIKTRERGRGMGKREGGRRGGGGGKEGEWREEERVGGERGGGGVPV